MKIGKWTIGCKDLIWGIICLFIVIMFLVGIAIIDRPAAAQVISGASTSASILLSLIAILYTMIEGAQSSAMNQETINGLKRIDQRLETTIEQLNELRAKENRIKVIIPQIKSQVESIKESGTSSGATLDDKVAKELDNLLAFLGEDIEK